MDPLNNRINQLAVHRSHLPRRNQFLDASLLKTCIFLCVTFPFRNFPASKQPPPAVKMPPKGSTIHPPKPPADAPPTAASIQMKANSVGIGEYELPKTTLTKLAKGSVSFVFLVGRDEVGRVVGAGGLMEMDFGWVDSG